MELPSKELLSEVLGFKVVWLDYELSHIVYDKSLTCTDEINIYELMHMMKEWAWTTGYYYWYENTQIHIKELGYSPKVHIDFESKRPFNTEIDIKACEWILTQKENNGKA